MPSALPFQLDRHLGAGGAGDVWLAQRVGGRTVAVKFLRAGVEQGEVVREVRLQARLSHPSILPVLDFGALDAPLPGGARPNEGRPDYPAGTPWLMMEYADRGTLGGLVGRIGRPLGWWEVRDVLLALTGALAHAHARGLLHRDLKPENVLLMPGAGLRECVRLADFGIAVALDEPATLHPQAGTVLWRAPEQAEGRSELLGPWTDLWALGALAWWLLVGKAPHGERRPRLDGGAEHLPRLRPRGPVPAGLESLLRGMLIADPCRRTGVAGEVRSALEALGPPGPAARPVGRAGGTVGGAGTFREDPFAAHAPPDALRGGHIAVPPSWRASPPLPSAVLTPAAVPMAHRTVGRERVRDALWGHLLAVAETGEARAVLLRGAPGVGKRHLQAWMGLAAAEVGLPVVTVRHAGDEARTGLLAGLREALGLGHVLSLASPGQREAGLDAVLERLALAEPDLRRAVRALLAGTAPDTAPAPDPDLIPTLLGRLATGRPLVLLVENVERGALTWAALGRLLRPGHLGPKLLLVGAWEGAGEPAGVPLHNIDLPPLGPVELADLARQVTGAVPAVVDAALAVASGQPGFLLEILRHWHASDVLVREELGLTFRPDRRPTLPASAREWYAQRAREVLGGLGRAERVALFALAALGPDVAPADWERVCHGLGVPASAGLLALLARERLIEEQGSGWRFQSSAVIEVLEEAGRAGGEWVAVHVAAVEALQDTLGAERLARLLLVAGRAGDALPLLRRASLERRRVGEYADAERLLLEWETHAAELPGSDVRWGETRLARANLLLEWGRDADARALLHRVNVDAARFRWRGLQPGIALNNAMALRRSHEVAASRALALDAEREFERQGNLLGAGRAALHAGTACRKAGDATAALEAYGRAEAWFAAAPVGVESEKGLADVLSERANALIGLGAPLEEALRLLDEAQERYERLASGLAKVAFCETARGEAQRELGRYVDAEATWRRALDIYTRLGHRHRIVPIANLATLPLYAGDRARTVARCTELLEADPAACPVEILLALCAADDRLDEGAWLEQFERAAEGVRSGTPTYEQAGLADRAARYATARGLRVAAETAALAAADWHALCGREAGVIHSETS